MRKFRFLSLALGLIYASSIVVAQDQDQQPTDAGITASVKSELIRKDETKARQINVETENGVVQLSGFVDSQQAKDAATATARDVRGVKSVRNELIVRESDRSLGQTTDDTVIAAKVKTELATDASLATARDVKVEVRSGVVQLSGFVPSVSQKQEAEQIARRVAGVKEVRNDIEVQQQR